MKLAIKSVFLLFTSIFLVLQCDTSDQNKVKIDMPQLLPLISPTDGAMVYYYLSDRKIDTDKTSNCGTASPTTSTTTGTIPGQTTPVSTGTTGSSTTQSLYTISSYLIFKDTEETLTLKFVYNINQFQGSIDPTQGFILTGGLFNNTATGKTGTVKWANQGIGYIDSSNRSAQSLSYFDLEVNLVGTFTQGATTGQQPTNCYTADNVNCTTTQTTSTCSTFDNKVCISTNTQGATPITILGTLNCNSPNTVPN
ncbi:MAG: hypothetical protein H7A23_17430 [Leptospiraceae bacterium]|nr:hypothetical protein [Leptospiraceae bacterium]MCP5496331.1 hypothetical protein [Leptospiraceae bacterium]